MTELVIRALINGILIGAIYGMLGMGFSMVYGIVNLPNFAHGAFAMWGMYLLITLAKYTKIGPYPGFILLLFIFFISGLLIYKYMFKYILDIEHEMQIVFCLGLMIIFSNLAIVFFGPTSHLLTVQWLEKIIRFGDIAIRTATIVGGVVSVLFVIIIHLFFAKTETGKAIRACADNRRGALLTGLNVEKMYAIAIGISVVCSGIAGLALAPLIPIHAGVGFEYAVLACLIAVLGGAGSMGGALVAGFITGLLLSFQQIFYDLSLAISILYGIMLAILMFRPTGLFGAREIVD
jgi:branched-chain amino acid transport system permease protein